MSDYRVPGPARLVRWIMLRTGDGPLRRLWALLYSALIKGVAITFRAGGRVSAVYLRGSFAIGDPVYGFSDVDIVAVVESDAAHPGVNGWKLRERLNRMYRAIPSLCHIVEAVVLETRELEEATRAPFLANESGTEPFLPLARFTDSQPLSRNRGPGPRIDRGAGLYGPLRPRFRLVSGSDVLASMPPSPPEYRWLWAWAEVQFNWKHVLRTCANPHLPQTAYHCAKYVASPLHLWLWLEHGEAVAKNYREVLERSLRVVPEHEAMISAALELLRNAARVQEAPLAELLPWLIAMTSQLARRLGAEAEAAGGIDVRLRWDTQDPLVSPCGAAESPVAAKRELLPLADWRAVVLPGLPDEAFELVPGPADDIDTIGQAARSSTDGRYLALQHGDLLLFPCGKGGTFGGLGPSTLRGIQCLPTDPVSFAVVKGRYSCRFPNMPGWSARDEASRAVAEHLARLARPETAAPLVRLAEWLSAARVALFYDSLTRGEPELALTVGAAARLLGGAAEEAWESYRAARLNGAAVDERTVHAIEARVRGLRGFGR